MISIRYQIISPNGRVPTRATDESACYDVSSAEDVTIQPGDTVAVHTGIKIIPQKGFFIDVRSRSGMARKGISISNSPGTVDSDYRGELLILLYNHSVEPYVVCIGHRIAQIGAFPVPQMRFVETEHIDNPEGVGHRGWGSTGK